MCFRIVRILGNGNIKLVLADENNECNSKLIKDTSSLIGGYTNEFNYTNLETNLTKWLNGEQITPDNELVLVISLLLHSLFSSARTNLILPLPSILTILKHIPSKFI